MMTEEIEGAVNFINNITGSYSIDTDILYTTGQSIIYSSNNACLNTTGI